MKTKRLTELALLTAAALIVFIIELRLPDLSPVPGVKLGLANIFTVYAIYRFKCSEVLLMVLTRVFLGAVFSSNFSALIYSLAGASLCLAGMLLIKKIIPQDYIWLCSIFGAVMHNTGQTAAAVIVMGTLSVAAYYPVLVISGCIAGAFTGFTAGFVIKRLDRK
ncbi:MAG: Gx transporter family protein [Ruminococcus sp.]|nr:Gx transporter family protein [Ruminococcus sp.]